MYPIHGLYYSFQELWSSDGSGSRSVTSDPAAFFLSPFRYARMPCISGTQLKLFFQVRCNTYVRMLFSSKNENAIKLHEIYWGLSPPRPAGLVLQGLCSSQDYLKYSEDLDFPIEFWHWAIIFCSVMSGNFYFYFSMNVSITRIVNKKVPLWVNILFPVPDTGQLQFLSMFLCRYETW